jgi:hypothetical protein
MEKERRSRMVTMIHPAHSFGAHVRAVVKIERQRNLVPDSFFRREWLARLRLRGDGYRSREHPQQ